MEAVSPDIENKAFAVVFLIWNLAYSPPHCPDFFQGKWERPEINSG
jgi:hypothetical protein